MLLFEVIKLFILIGFTTSVNGFDDDDPDGVKQLEFIRKLNKYRKSMAKHYNIFNMHELTYNEELVTNSRIPRRRNFLNGSYEGGAKYLKSLTIEYLSKNPEEKAKEVENGKRKYSNSRALEHFNPLQTDIACFKKKDILCLYGFEISTISPTPAPTEAPEVIVIPLNNDDKTTLEPTPSKAPEPDTTQSIVTENIKKVDSTTSPTPAPFEAPTLTPSEAPEVVVIPPHNDDKTTLEPTTSEPSESKTTQYIVTESLKEVDSTTSPTSTDALPEITEAEPTDNIVIHKEPESTPLKPTEMSEIDKKIKVYLESEGDGDDYDEDHQTTTETSSSGTSIQVILVVLFMIFCVFLGSF